MTAQAPQDGSRPLVIIVDDDLEFRTAVDELLQSVGIESLCFGSTQDVLDAQIPDRPGCMILDVRMPGLSGLDLQRLLAARGDPKPIIFLTGHGDIPMSVHAMKAGAIDFLTKPFRDQELLDAVGQGIDRDLGQRAQARAQRSRVERLETLTPREREVIAHVAQGRLNKQIAFDLGISEITVKLHRSNVMRKMNAASVGDIVRVWEALPRTIRDGRS